MTGSEANELSLNIKKSNFVNFQPGQKKLNYEINLKVFDYHTNTSTSIERKNYVKYLGVLIDENLSWKISYYPLSFKNN